MEFSKKDVRGCYQASNLNCFLHSKNIFKNHNSILSEALFLWSQNPIKKRIIFFCLLSRGYRTNRLGVHIFGILHIRSSYIRCLWFRLWVWLRPPLHRIVPWEVARLVYWVWMRGMGHRISCISPCFQVYLVLLLA